MGCQFVFVALLFLLSVACLSPVTASSYTYVSAQTIHDQLAVGDGLQQVRPYPKDCLTTCEWYLNDYSCLGPFGPASAYGPLGLIGPLGSSEYARDLARWASWVRDKKVMISLPVAMSNPSNAANQSEPTSWLDWGNLSEKVNHNGGPLSGYGPLGPYGPLGDAYSTIMPKINDFAAHLAAQGVWTVLGPLGPFGPLGPLGPLGPVGATGYMTDKLGNFIDSQGNVVRNYSVPWDFSNGQTVYRSYDLVEEYQPAYAQQLTDNDCSWMTHSSALVLIGDTEQYAFTSAEEQYVTILVVPQYQLDDFNLQVTVDQTQVIISANPSSSFVDWVQIKVRPGAQIVAQVELGMTVPFAYWSHDYRLYVVGSTSAFTSTPIKGPHIIRY